MFSATPNTALVSSGDEYSVEYFHIYTDEKINDTHQASIEYLKQMETIWDISHHRILFIDDYNPTDHKTSHSEILSHLEKYDVTPHYWAFEGDLINNAILLLNKISSNKIRKSYRQYIEKNGKYPCSLLTASWYLTRLGALPHENVISSTGPVVFLPVNRLINILPQDYKTVETRALELIKHSEYSDYADKIQDLFLPMSSGRAVTLW